jgi:hypothetical protein
LYLIFRAVMTGQLQDSDSDAPTVGNAPANSITLPSFQSLNLRTVRRPQPVSNAPVVNAVPVIVNAVPVIVNAVPVIANAVPDIVNTVPDIVNAVPVIVNAVPVIVRNINFPGPLVRP